MKICAFAAYKQNNIPNLKSISEGIRFLPENMTTTIVLNSYGIEGNHNIVSSLRSICERALFSVKLFYSDNLQSVVIIDLRAHISNM